MQFGVLYHVVEDLFEGDVDFLGLHGDCCYEGGYDVVVFWFVVSS